MTTTTSYPTIVTTRRVVPNFQPIDPPTSYRIAIVGEAPGEDEENYGAPFVGKSGQLLNNILRSVGIDRNKCFVGNVCQVRPPANRLAAFPWDGEEIQSGIDKLAKDLQIFNPNIIVALGATPLHVLKVGRAAPPTRAGQFEFPHKIASWRGSLFKSPVDLFLGRKVISSLHPAYVLREWSGYPLLKFDLKRAAEEANDPELTLPTREIITRADAGYLCYLMDTWPSGLRCSLDIEGGLPVDLINEKAKKKKADGQVRYGWPCVSLSSSPTRAYVIAWLRYNEREHAQLLRSFARLMFRDDVPKVLQNQLYDNFVLSYGYGIPIRNVTEDTMIKGWEIYAELPRSLATQASIYTRQPFWKDDSMYASDGEGLFHGCGMDAAVTLEICSAQDQVLTADMRRHYETVIALQRAFLYMELRGIRYNQEAVAAKLARVNRRLQATGAWLEKHAGAKLRGPAGSLSSKALAKVLYTDLGYPPQYAKGEGGRRSDKLTTDVEALLKLKRHRETDKFLSRILRHRHLEGIRETLQITADKDGRVRCGYSLEAETGRVKCYTSPTGSGANLQTIQKELRTNYVADPGYDFFQVDLEGADGWTVAAYCKALGDSTMLDDYMARMKPAKIIALLYAFGPVINELSRDEVKFLHDRVFPIVLSQIGKWLYLGCKRVQHGSSYGMGIPTMCLNILKDSFKESGKPLYMEHATAKQLQNLFFSRYPGVLRWHAWAQSQLNIKGPLKLSLSSGNTRIFFGRRYGQNISDTVKEFLAHAPQHYTTWATNMAMLNLWSDPENRRRDGSLIIEPLHQVHDALCGQWPQDCRDWARSKVKSYFENEIEIAGTRLTIPFEGCYGSSWGTANNPL